MTSRYDNLFQCSFPYWMAGTMRRFFEEGKSTSTIATRNKRICRHLRSASVRKFMVGHEMLEGIATGLTAETSGATSS
ncbi:hypothetical protein O9992_05100 [Vibrio lentus]|nr:hypothetical protein [Vibrio lentus]